MSLSRKAIAMEKENKQSITLEEYQEKYSKPENIKSMKAIMFIFIVAVGLIIFTCLFLMVMKLFDIHEIAGYVGIGVAVLLFIFVYIVPLVAINKKKAFITNINGMNPREAQRHNKQLRNEIADKMIELKAATKTNEFYSDEKIGKLAIARQTRNNEEVKNVLTEIYKTDVKTAADKMIKKSAMQVGLFTALSQSEKLDTLLVITFELKLIKDLVYLYGFRPSDAKMYKIYRTVVINSLVSYGVATSLSGLGGNVVGLLGKAVNAVPVVGNAIGSVIDSAVQGVANASLAAILGFQTQKYLKKEYKLQDILDNVIITDEEQEKEEKELIATISTDLKKQVSGKKKVPAKA